MDDERLPKRLFYVATDTARQGGQKRCDKDTLLINCKLTRKPRRTSPRITGLEKSSEGRSSKLRNQPDRLNQSQKSSPQVSNASDPQHQHPTPANMPILSTNTSLADRYRQTTPDIILQQPAASANAPSSHLHQPINKPTTTTTTTTTTTKITTIKTASCRSQ
nr:unnamed protein product [Spirometra erinaceieuropaei]